MLYEAVHRLLRRCAGKGCFLALAGDNHQSPIRNSTQTLRALIRELPSTMARLAFLSGLRDPNTGVYHHPAIAARLPKTEIDRALRALHIESFELWLKYRLEEQKADLDLYFSGLACGRDVAIRTWCELESYRLLLPASASPGERRLFINDLEVLLRLQGEAQDYCEESRTGVPEQTLLTTAECAVLLRVSQRTIRWWAQIGEITAIKAGHQWRFFAKDIREWLSKQRARGLGPKEA